MVEVTEADTEARTATLELSREEAFNFRNAIFSADYDGDGPTDSEVWQNLRDKFPVPTKETVAVKVRLSVGEMADVSNGLIKASEVAEDDDRFATARRLLRQANEVHGAMDEAGEPKSASWRSDLAMTELQRLADC